MGHSTTEFENKIQNGEKQEDQPKFATYRKAFITAPYTTDKTLLLRALEDRGFVPFELDDLPSRGRSISELLEECLKESDLVIAVAGEEGAMEASVQRYGRMHHDEMQFALGYAAALKKRILVLVPRNGTPLFGLPCLYFHPDEFTRESIDFSLDLILNTPPKLYPGFTDDQVVSSTSLGLMADDFLAEVRSMTGHSATDLKQVVSDVFKACGIENVIMAPAIAMPTYQVEMAVMSDDFIPWIGALLPVEFDISTHFSSDLLTHQERFSRSLDEIHLSWGLLIHRCAGQLSKEQAYRSPNVLAISVESFIEGLRTVSPAEFLRLWRNRRVRGIA